eukprot:TRINITY_DN2422_c0_g1_i1.p2 TRINITY_DN2422_c0_g1~~TRINITY_DN2422_c0_g1_i1.p2  ORF type:complete len:308 (-),score=17.96 TRINITY_DN2422_c0_g1_i1:1688-2611(-)
MCFNGLFIFSMVLIISAVQGYEYELPEISRSGQLLMETVSDIAYFMDHVNITCNGEQMQVVPILKCEGSFELNVKHINGEKQRSTNVACEGNFESMDDGYNKKISCQGLYSIKTVHTENNTFQEYQHSVKCNTLYSLEQFKEGEHKMNETCFGSMEEIEIREAPSSDGLFPVELEYKDALYSTNTYSFGKKDKCIAECDGAEVDVQNQTPCEGMYLVECTKKSLQVFQRMCEGLYRQDFAESCSGFYSITLHRNTNTVHKECADHFSSFKQSEKSGAGQRFDHCQGFYTYVTVRNLPSQDITNNTLE